MAQPTDNCCDPVLLERLINQSLAGEQLATVETRLNECASCREMLERMVGPTGFWDIANSRLFGVETQQPPDASDCTSDVSPPLEFLRALLGPTDHPDSMGRLGSYEITGVIGIGGMGIVVKGHDASLNRYVAVKLLSPQLANNGAARQRFSREAKAAAAIIHENVLAIHAIDTWKGIPYLVMPYIRGCSLAKRIRQEGILPFTDILRIAQQIASGLSEAHRQGLVHRDIKPANILLGQGSERLKISDFGLARAADDASLTRSGAITGTPLYMSPEQSRGEPVDTRSDIFSLGTLLFEACTGHPPFQAETPFGIIRRIQEDTPRSIHDFNPQVPQWFCQLVEVMLSKSPDARRFDSAELADLFRCGLAHQLQPAGTPLPEPIRALQPATNFRVWITLSLLVIPILFFIPVVWTMATTTDGHGLRSHPPKRTTSKKSLPVVSSEPDKVSRLQETVATTAGHAISYRMKVGEKIYFRGQLSIQQNEGRMESPIGISLTVLAQPSENEYELKYEFTHQNFVRYNLQGLRNPFSPSAITGEVATLNNCSKRGRFKIRNDGAIQGRSQPGMLPGQLGPILEVLFPSLDGLEPNGAEVTEVRSIDLPCILRPFSIGPAPPDVDTILVERISSTTVKLDRKNLAQLTSRSVDVILSDDTKTPANERQKIGLISKYQIDPETGQVHSINIHRDLSDLNSDQRASHSGCELILERVDRAAYEQPFSSGSLSN